MKWLATLALVVACPGCVVGAEVQPTSAEARQPPPEPGAPPSAARLLHPGPDAHGHQLPARGEGEVWVAGYWHFDGVRYRWVPGQLEASRPRYLRRYAAP